jgi:aldehyde dehydrogenase (NAD+)
MKGPLLMVAQTVPTNGAPATAAATHEIPGLVARLRATFDGGKTRPLSWRLQQLESLHHLLVEREDEIIAALRADVGKPAIEAYAAEVSYCKNELKLIRSKLAKWVRPEKVSAPMFTKPGKAYIHREPLGVVLVIGPWNYPFQLVMAPLAGAIAAGNTVVLKPSEVASETSALVARLLPEYLDTDAVAVVEGGVPETTALLEEHFDHIFYTGNGAVARIVMGAAAKNLTPVTLELGGKSPCIVDKEANLDVAVKRIAWGKFYNAGQTCVAPDYILAHEDVYEEVCAGLKKAVETFYGTNPKESRDLARIINERHHRRLMKLMDSGETVVGGEGDEKDRFIAPTVLRDVSPDSPVMQEEIFGPILPVLKVSNMEEAIRLINDRPKPLALYVYSESRSVQHEVINRTSSGGVTINHAWLHLAVPNLPFGGVGESGMGAYHGKGTFETFCHKRSVLNKPTNIDPSIMYPPYTGGKVKWLKRLL